MLSGLPGGACALARVPAEERRDGEQEAEGPTGGTAESQPTGEEGAGGHSPGASGAAVSDVEDNPGFTHTGGNCKIQWETGKIITWNHIF